VRSSFPLLAAFVLMMMVILAGPSSRPPAKPAPAPDATSRRGKPAVPPDTAGRLVISVVDAMRLEMMDEPKTMPLLRALAKGPTSNWLPVRTCKGNFTLPCMQTLFEGKESPFASGLHNYTGFQGAATSLPGMVHELGQGVVLIADHPVSSLYSSYARIKHNTDTWTTPYLQRDLHAMDLAIKYLDDPRVRLVIVHTIGSDKATHYHKPGDKGYLEHFNAVDRKLQELIAKLDLSKDAMMITGDHGHGVGGHHTQRSLAVFLGRPYQELFAAWKKSPGRVEQRDLLYLMGYPLGLAMPAGYEGTFLSTDSLGQGTPSARVRAYEALQRRVLTAQGLFGPTLTAQVQGARARLRQQEQADLLARLPLLLCYLGLVMWWPMLARARSRWLAVGLFGGGAVLMVKLVPVTAAPWLALPAGLAALVPLWFQATRRWSMFVLVLTALAAALSYAALPWSELLHVRDGFSMSYPLFLVLVPAAGAALAWLYNGSPPQVLLGAAAFGLFCLPSGPYFYQSGPNLLRGPVTVVLLLGLWELFRHRREVLAWVRRGGRSVVMPLVLIGLSAPFIYMQQAGGWEWGGTFLEHWLKPVPAWGRFAIYYAAGVAVASMLPAWRARVLVLVMWAAAHVLGVHLGHLQSFQYVAAFVPVLFYIGWLELYLRHAEDRGAGGGDDEVIALMLLGALGCAVWFIFKGFFINRVDFSFAYDLVGDIGNERQFVLMASALVGLKYAWSCAILMVYTSLRLGRRRAFVLLSWLLVFLHLKLALLLVQIFAGALGTSEKLYQLGIGDFAFLGFLFVLIWIVYPLYWLGSRISRAFRGASTV